MKAPELIELNSSSCTERSIKKHYPEFYRYIITSLPESLKWTEKLYWYYNKLSSHPVCKICGAPVKFINLKNGYREFCSQRCMNMCEDIQERKKKTSLGKYGTENPMGLEEVKNKIKSTCLERYGEDNIFKTKKFKEELKRHNREKYGVDYYLQTEECQNKIKSTCLERYGVSHNTQIPTVKNRMSIKWNKQLILKDPYVISVNNEIITRKCSNPKCNKCQQKQYDIIRYLYNSRLNHGQEICPIQNPIGITGKNTDIEIFVKNVLDKNNISYKTNVRNIISPKELDIYIPSKNIAIECNGCYWHSDIYKDNEYHYNKFIKCKEQGIQLISLWYDYIMEKPAIVESIILSKLGVYEKRLYARKCTIKEIPPKECNQFLNENHLQGSCPSLMKIGLYYNDELVSVMTFSKKRLGIGVKDDGYELVRFCNKIHYQVVGGASRLFKYFVTKYNPTQVTSFSSNDISDGGLYDKLGFIKDSETRGSYWYVDPANNKRYHRFRFRKSELIKMGFDKDKSESEIMRNTKYLKIYDSGQMKWVWDKKTSGK